MEKKTKNQLLVLAEELYESSKETIGEIFEMDIEELDYPALKYESRLIIQLAKMVEILDEAEKKDELDSVDDKLDFRFFKDEFENEDELRAFLQGVLYEPNLDLDEFEEVIDNIVKQIL